MTPLKDWPAWLLLIAAIVICLLPGALGGLATQTGPDSWYATIEKPSFNPPNWIFGPVWTALYLLMGISLFLAIRAGLDRVGAWLFGTQLALNTLWSFLFFWLESPGVALIGIIVLWVAILFTIIRFWRSSRVAASLLFPYLAWVSFATVLNAAIFALN